MITPLPLLYIARTLVLPMAAGAGAPLSPDTKAAPAARPKGSPTTAEHHKTKCCSGRETQQLKPPEPTK
jgi:hypothetical protein